MQNRKILSRVCLGTAALGADGLCGEPLERAFAILDAYYAIGGRFLDTANVYGRWGIDHTNASERVIGLWLRERSVSDVTVMTKACHYLPSAPAVSRVDERSMRDDLDESRTSLGLDRLDICLLHRDNPELDIRTIVDFCVRLVDEGKLERFGFSNFRAERVSAALEYLGERRNCFFGVSNEQSLAMDGVSGYYPPDGMAPIDGELRELSLKYGFTLLPYSSLAHGFFAKLHDCGAVYSDGIWSGTEAFRGRRDWLTAENGRAYNRLQALSDEYGISENMLSLAYLLAAPNTIPIMSVSRPDQLSELPALLSLNRSAADLAI